MKNCIKCSQQIEDGDRFCPKCGKDQNDQSKEKAGVLIIDCQHCGATGECKKGITAGKIHSCQYCVSKSGSKDTGLFPRVPCAYCQGVGKRVIDLKIQKENQQSQKPKNKN